MIWSEFPTYFWSILSIWSLAVIFTFVKIGGKGLKSITIILSFLGAFLLSVFIISLWINLGRPPLRTLGETRLWYSFFSSVVGVIFYLRWHYIWFTNYTLLLALLFLAINYLYPETHSKTLMPALQSVWFVPHVVVYLFAYALLGASSVVALRAFVESRRGKSTTIFLASSDNLVHLGFSFLTLGLLFGALWAKEAWGHYWTWDPKETWAFITWISYLSYIHLRKGDLSEKRSLYALLFAFLFLLICWFGVNYLPTTAQSVHTYGVK